MMPLNLHKIYHPQVFQGSLSGSNYFEGWYFKQVSSDFSAVLSVIPGVSLSSDRHAFIQVIDGISGKTWYIEYPLSSFRADGRKLIIRIGDSQFSGTGMSLDISRPDLTLTGSLEYTGQVTWPRRPWAPGIMGWYSFVPGMECYHGVVSLDHSVKGSLNFNGQELNFDDGRGYIEKDWGTSMPESWIWLHTNSFAGAGTSVMLSVARIPWRKSYFTGFIAFVLHERKIYRFATYNGSRITEFSLSGQYLSITLENRQVRLTIRAHQKTAGKLKAPVKGLMERYIKESVDSDVEIHLSQLKGKSIFSGSANRSGLELVGDPENLVRL